MRTRPGILDQTPKLRDSPVTRPTGWISQRQKPPWRCFTNIDMISTGNLFAPLPPPAPVETLSVLWQTPGVRVEQIVSWGHVTPPDEWYDQQTDEWVVLLSGAARLRIAGRVEFLEMRPGDWMLIPARMRHRVEWTDPDQETFWLAIHAQTK